MSEKKDEVGAGGKAFKGISARGMLEDKNRTSKPVKTGPTAAEMAAKSEAERRRLSDAADKKRIAKEKAEKAKKKKPVTRYKELEQKVIAGTATSAEETEFNKLLLGKK